MAFVPVAGETNRFLLVPRVTCGVFLPGIRTYCCLFGAGVLGITGAGVLGVAGTGWFLGVGALYCGGGCLVGTDVWGAGVGLALYA